MWLNVGKSGTGCTWLSEDKMKRQLFRHECVKSFVRCYDVVYFRQCLSYT